MSIAENITNAVSVMFKTYQSIEKLMEATDRICKEEGFIAISPISPKFLRWKSDQSASGWLTTSFIKAYQVQEAPSADVIGGRNISIYGMEILLYPETIIKISRFDFLDNGKTGKLSTTDHWLFHWPLKDELEQSLFNISETEFEGRTYWRSTAKLPETKQKYRDMEQAVFLKNSLVEIKASNLKERVFDEFRYLARIPKTSKS